MINILDVLNKYGVGCRSPQDVLFSEGNKKCGFISSVGVFEIDKEEFLHAPCNTFPCHVPNCDNTFSTMIEYDLHYNTSHRFTCAECKKTLPSPHLLDLHISETHDSFFAVLSQRKPSYKCFLESCKELFNDGKARREHCISVHEFPGDFRFDEFRKQKLTRKKKNEIKIDVTEASSSNTAMDIAENSVNKIEEKKKVKYLTNFGRGRGRTFLSFTKDLNDSLPQI